MIKKKIISITFMIIISIWVIACDDTAPLSNTSTMNTECVNDCSDAMSTESNDDMGILNADQGIDEATRNAVLNCVIEWQEKGYWNRVSQASTVFLPKIKEDTDCQGLSWVLMETPSDSQQQIQSDGMSERLTVDQIGTYTFGIQKDNHIIAYPHPLEVVSALDRPFHNYNYFPSDRAQITVDGQLWVAGVYTPQVARIDLISKEVLDPIVVGSWPTALSYVPQQNIVLVAHKAEDTLGFIDVNQGTLIDAIWVGDEPSNIIWDATRQQAYVALASAHAIAVVDLETRTVIQHIETVFDPLAMALNEEEGTLYVASHRSGQSEFYPYNQREVSTEKDIAIIDVNQLVVTGFMLEVASTIHAMRWYDDGLWVTATTARPQGPLNDAESVSFSHELVHLNLAQDLSNATESLQRFDLTRQESSSGPTATLQGFVRCHNFWWVVADGSDQVIQLEMDGTEVQRFESIGKARSLACDSSGIWVWSPNRLQVIHIDTSDTSNTYEMKLNDTRSETLKFGLELFSNQGDGSGANRSCNQCHVDGLSDNVVWNAGPVESRKLSRPFRWLEGTSYIGWDGYVGSVKISGYVGGATINHRGNTQEALALGSYLASIMPAPAANQWTYRDGSLSDQALVGQSLFEGEAGCVACHSGAHLTNGTILEQGFTEGRTDIPSLVDVNRLESWYKTGSMSTLEQAVEESATLTNITLDDMQIKAITQYMKELTGRSFFVLQTDLSPRLDKVAVDGSLALTLSAPVWDDEDNISHIQLVDAQDQVIDCSIKVDVRHVSIQPRASLQAQATYRLRIGTDFMSDDGRLLMEAYELEFQTAATSDLRLDGVYDLTVTVPMLNFEEGVFDYDRMVSQTSKLTAFPTENGADIEIFYGDDMLYKDQVVIEGNRLYSRDLPIAVGPAFLNILPLDVSLQDADDDGVADSFQSDVVLTGPGVYLDEIPLELAASSDEFVCVVGSEGPHAPVITMESDDVIIDWGSEGTLGLFITTPNATLPLGPGTVSGGETFWVVTATEFPTTFYGPVRYGQIPDFASDTSADNGGVLGGKAFESGQCVRFSVVIDFQYSHTTMEWP